MRIPDEKEDLTAPVQSTSKSIQTAAQDFIDNDPALNKKRWQNRRRMAWWSLISMTIVTFLILFTNLVPDEKMKIVSEVITWYYLSCASIIGAYMGFTTWATKGK